jgi:hypothetical protein
MGDWNYDIEDVPEGDARKIVTLEKDGMIWVGIRAFRRDIKKWINNGVDGDERVVAWQDLPKPGDPRFIAVPKEILENFERTMHDEVIPDIERDTAERVERAVNSRNRVILR